MLAESFVGEAPLPGDAPVDAHTRYDMASLSKILGPTMIALKALEDGTLKLDDTVGGEFPFAPADKRDITVKMLMTHTGGLYPDFKLEQLIDTPDKTLECILNHPLQQAPGTAPACPAWATYCSPRCWSTALASHWISSRTSAYSARWA